MNRKLQEHNSCRFNSQKENMMQALNVNVAKPVTNAVLVNEIVEPVLKQKSDKSKVQESNSFTLKKDNSINRFLEAYGDCV